MYMFSKKSMYIHKYINMEIFTVSIYMRGITIYAQTHIHIYICIHMHTNTKTLT